MKREGRQHGMVRSLFCTIPSPLNPKSQRRIINKFDTPTTAGRFVKVATKPTNHSKFTGRCGKPKCSECRAQPACKSKNKAKGSHKLKSTSDVSIDCKYISWQLVDQTTNGMKKFFDYSATGILDCLANSYDDYSDYDYDEYYYEDVWSFWSDDEYYNGYDEDVWSFWSDEDDYCWNYDGNDYCSNVAKTIDVEQEALDFEEKLDRKRLARKRTRRKLDHAVGLHNHAQLKKNIQQSI